MLAYALLTAVDFRPLLFKSVPFGKVSKGLHVNEAVCQDSPNHNDSFPSALLSSPLHLSARPAKASAFQRRAIFPFRERIGLRSSSLRAQLKRVPSPHSYGTGSRSPAPRRTSAEGLASIIGSGPFARRLASMFRSTTNLTTYYRLQRSIRKTEEIWHGGTKPSCRSFTVSHTFVYSPDFRGAEYAEVQWADSRPVSMRRRKQH